MLRFLLSPRFWLVYAWFAGANAFFFPMSGFMVYRNLFLQIASLFLICNGVRWAWKRSRRDSDDPIAQHRRTMDRMREVFTPEECDMIEQDLKQWLLENLRNRMR